MRSPGNCSDLPSFTQRSIYIPRLLPSAARDIYAETFRSFAPFAFFSSLTLAHRPSLSLLLQEAKPAFSLPLIRTNRATSRQTLRKFNSIQLNLTNVTPEWQETIVKVYCNCPREEKTLCKTANKRKTKFWPRFRFRFRNAFSIVTTRVRALKTLRVKSTGMRFCICVYADATCKPRKFFGPVHFAFIENASFVMRIYLSERFKSSRKKECRYETSGICKSKNSRS